MNITQGRGTPKITAATAARGDRHEYILYVGNYVDEAIVRERGLPTHNVAGSNRIYRIASAFAAANYRPIVVSPAASLRMRRPGGVYNRSRMRRNGSVIVAYTPSLNPGLLNVLLAPFMVNTALWSLYRSRRPKAIVVYNFSPLLVLTVLIFRFFTHVSILNNVEDVSVPRWRDWRRDTEARPIQQLVFYLCMKWISALSHGFVLPTRRFRKYLPSAKPALVTPGCIDVVPEHRRAADTRLGDLRILFAGKIELEHGADTFVQAMRIIDADQTVRLQSIDLTGGGSMAKWVSAELETFSRIPIRYHGFVSVDTYRELLTQSDLCIALQRADGRFGDLKTPSKVFEYLGFGKAVISSAVGDLRDLPTDIIEICDSNDPAQLAAKIRKLAEAPAEARAMGGRAYEFAKDHFAFNVIGRRLRGLLEGPYTQETGSDG